MNKNEWPMYRHDANDQHADKIEGMVLIKFLVNP